MKRSILQPSYLYSAHSGTAEVEIELRCECHPGEWGGYGRLAGVVPGTDTPVYRLRTGLFHRELGGQGAALTVDGLMLREGGVW